MNLNIPLLSIIIFLPLVGGLLVLLTPGQRAPKWVALIVSLLTFAVSCLLFVWWKTGEPGMQFVERASWVPQFNIQYFVGVDGLSLFLVLLTTLITALVIIFSWEGVEKQVKTYLFLILALEAGMIGVFVALDLVLFYVFWELTLIPMYFLIGGWGDSHGTYTFLGRTMSWRIYAALKFFLYTFAASALMLVAILVLYVQGGTFDLLQLQAQNIAPAAQTWLFLAFALAFAVKVPIFPFHTWLPDAHVAAPTGGSVILAAVLLKMGTYGFVRFCLPAVPGCDADVCAVDRGARDHRHPLRRPRRAGAEGRQIAGRLLVRRTPRVRDAGDHGAERTGHRGRDAADGQPRAQHRRPVPDGRHDLQPAAHPPARGLRRPVEAGPALRVPVYHRGALVGRAARP